MAELIVAFDVPTGREALALAARLPALQWAKLGSMLYVREGPALLRAALGPDLWIVVPGVRAPGEASSDQARTVAPLDAVRCGATHLVVGRPITLAKDPAGVYQRLMEAL